jgi:4-hydroxyphenylpyruvate dioxygenase-like putative hemolysin
MTDTASRSATRRAANQAGARVDPDAYAKAADFLPLKGIDHVEFWVGNARQAAAYYRALWGFTPIAYAGLETGVRDRAMYAMRQHDITLVLTAPLTPEGEIAEHVRAHGDGVHDIAFAVDDVRSAWHETTSRGARSSLEYAEAGSGEDGVLRRSAIHTYGEVIHSFIDRTDYHGVFAPGFRRIKRPARAAEGSRSSRSTTASGTSASARWTASSTSTATCSASASLFTTTTRSSTPSTAP